jgi:hypothetical protein
MNFEIPQQFLGKVLSGEYIRRGAIIKNAVSGEIVGHLKETGNLGAILSSMPSNHAQTASFIASNIQLFKIQDTLNALQMISSIGSTASVLNLGVTIGGFAIVINKLNKIENKVDSVLQTNKEIKEILESLNIKSEYLQFAELKTALENIDNAEITLDNKRKVVLLNESNSSLRKMKNYFQRFIMLNNPIYISGFSEDDILSIYQRYFSTIYGVIQTEFILQDYKICRKDIKEFSNEIQQIQNSFDSQKMFRARNDFYKQYDSPTILTQTTQLEKAKLEMENFKSILNETFLRIESLDVELDYLEDSKLSYTQYITELKTKPDNIILIPKIIKRSNKMEESNKSDDAMKAGATAVVGAGVGYGVVAASGITAIGAVGSGAGFGSAAGPVGAIAGAVVGLAIYGIYKIFK